MSPLLMILSLLFRWQETPAPSAYYEYAGPGPWHAQRIFEVCENYLQSVGPRTDGHFIAYELVPNAEGNYDLVGEDPRVELAFCMNELAMMGRDGIAAAPLVLPLLAHADLEVRVLAIDTLGHLGDAASLPRLRAFTASPHIAESYVAIEAVGRFHQPEDQALFASLAADHVIPGIRELAAQQLSRSAAATGSPGSENAHNGPHDEEARLAALQRARWLGGPYAPEFPSMACPSETWRYGGSRVIRPEDSGRSGRQGGDLIAVDGGQLRFEDQGEFIGRLTWVDAHGSETELLRENVHAVMPYGPGRWIVVTDFSAWYQGFLFALDRSASGEWSLSPITALPGRPGWSTPLGDGLFGTRLSSGFYVYDASGVVGTAECEIIETGEAR